MPESPDDDNPVDACLWILSSVAIVILLVVAVVQLIRGASLSSLIGWAVAIILIWLLSRSVRGWLRSRYRKQVQERQRARNERARRAYLAVLTDQPLVRPLILYLRPFNSGSEYRLWLGSLGTFGGSSALPDTGGLEVGLSKITAAFGDFVALGDDIETIGSGRVVTGDDNWRSTVRKLAEAATCIIMFPSPTAGVTWEMELLRDSGLIAKTVFLMPPLVVTELSGTAARLIDRLGGEDFDDAVSESAPEGSIRTGNEHAQSDWEEAREHYRTYNIELPEFEEYGQAFLLDADNNSVEICPLYSPLSGWRHRVDRQAEAQLRSRIERIGKATGSDWLPMATSLNAPANQHFLPLLSYIASMVERGWPELAEDDA